MILLPRLTALVSSPRRKAFFSLIVFNAAYQWFKTFSSSVLNPYYLSHGLTIPQLFTGNLIFFLTALILQLFLKAVNSRLSWRLAILSCFVGIMIISRLTNAYYFYLASFVSGFSIILFYVTYNITHFKLTPKHRTGISAAILTSTFPLIGFIAPLAAGLVAHFNYLYIWLLSAVFFAIVFYLTRFQTSYQVNFKLSFSAITPTRIFIFLEAIWEIVYFCIIPYYSLHFIRTPLYYGVYLSYLSLSSIASNLVLGRLTDRLQKRIVFVYPLTIIMALTTFLFPFALNNLIYWLVITGLIQFLVPQFWNLTTAMMVDTSKNTQTAFVSREFVLSFGRIIGIILVLINFSFQTRPTYIFYLFALVMLLFPLILFYNTRISKKYQYL